MGAASFRTWHVIARLMDGDAHLLSDDELAIARAVTQRDRFPANAVTEFYAGPGRRSGKSRFGAGRAVYHLATDYRDRLAPGEHATVACVATDKEQAGIIYSYARAMVMNSPLLREQLVRETADTLELAHRGLLKVYAGSFRATRGPTYSAVFIDEASFLRSEESANPDTELVRALRPGLVTLAGSLIVISSPYHKRGVMFDAHRKHFGQNDAPALYVMGASNVFNPTLDAGAIALAYQDDAVAAASEWGGHFRADLSAAFAWEWIEAATCSGVHERPRVATLRQGRAPHYYAFTDPAGGSGRDAWATAVVHEERDELVQDAVLEIRPSFSTTEAAARTAQFLKSYGLTGVSGDAYAGAWPRDALASHGVGYVTSELVKSDIYRECVALFSGGRVRLLDHARTLTQLRQVERRTRAGGRDSFDHPPGGNDDCSNALCGALRLAARSFAVRTHGIAVSHSRIWLDYAFPAATTLPPAEPLPQVASATACAHRALR
jgi:hypothetical protein